MLCLYLILIREEKKDSSVIMITYQEGIGHEKSMINSQKVSHGSTSCGVIGKIMPYHLLYRRIMLVAYLAGTDLLVLGIYTGNKKIFLNEIAQNSDEQTYMNYYPFCNYHFTKCQVFAKSLLKTSCGKVN